MSLPSTCGTTSRMMRRAANLKSFRQQAAWCRHMASLMLDPRDVAQWLGYSEDWDRMADREEKTTRGVKRKLPEAFAWPASAIRALAARKAAPSRASHASATFR